MLPIQKWVDEVEKKFLDARVEVLKSSFEMGCNKNSVTSQKFSEKRAIMKELKMEIGLRANQFLLQKDEIQKCNCKLLMDYLEYFEVAVLEQTEKSEQQEKRLAELANQVGMFWAGFEVQVDGVTYHSNELLGKMSERDYGVLRNYWIGFHDKVNNDLKPVYLESVQLSLDKHKDEGGKTDIPEEWLKNDFGVDGIEENMDSIFEVIFPLYRKLHAYVREKIFKHYKGIPSSESEEMLSNPKNQIPAHILGDMYGQQWVALTDLMLPYTTTASEDITAIMIEQNFNVEKMFKLAEEFFVSLGFEKMTDEFWQKSVFEMPTPRLPMQCQPLAVDMITPNDYRIRMCAEVRASHLTTIHHEMGHIVNFMQYRNLPYVYRSPATGAFTEAIGDTISLSAQTSKHLKAIGLTKTGSSVEETVLEEEKINDLMKRALFDLPTLVYIYVLEKWRFAFFREEFKAEEMNKQFWQLRNKYSGIIAPDERPQDAFDIGAKPHISLHRLAVMYFYSYVGKFQFHETLCKAAGQTEEFHDCDIFNSIAAGDKLRTFLEQGSSRPWKELMQEFTGTDNFQSTALDNYFKPLSLWLDDHIAKNEIPVGWDGEFE